jgi:hypothetical protein
VFFLCKLLDFQPEEYDLDTLKGSCEINGPNYSPDFQKTKFDITIFVQQAPPTSQKANKILNISYIHVWSVAKFS